MLIVIAHFLTLPAYVKNKICFRSRSKARSEPRDIGLGITEELIEDIEAEEIIEDVEAEQQSVVIIEETDEGSSDEVKSISK